MKLWMLPSYKPDTPSSQMRVYKIAKHLTIENEIIPYNLSINEKIKKLDSIHDSDFVLIQKWRNEFNQAEYISKLRGIKIFDIDDICEDQNVIDLINVSNIVFVANHYLYDWATKFNRQIHLVPTGIEEQSIFGDLYTQSVTKNIVIAKYGVDSYIKHIQKIPIWNQLHKKHGMEIKVMGLTKPTELGGFWKTFKLVPFSKFWEIYGKELFSSCLGIMPLSKSAQGKSAFSVLTMMSAGVPVVASPYGECDYIIKDGLNGFIARTSGDWFTRCDQILSDPKLRNELSIGARNTARKYNVKDIAKDIEQWLKCYSGVI